MWRVGGVFIVSQGWFIGLAAMFPWQRTAERTPRGWLAMNFVQTDIVKLVRPLSPSSKRKRQAPAKLVPKWGRLTTSWAHLAKDGPIWPSRSVDTDGDMYIYEFPL
jgi:hypothetical protein